MRVRLTLIALASLIAAALCIAGCGGSTAPGKRAVSLSIVAPTSGATIGVRDIVVAGTVTPASAAVTVGGEPVKVTNGSYQLPMQLAEPSETITITGQANGYTPTTATHDRSIQRRDRLGDRCLPVDVESAPGGDQGSARRRALQRPIPRQARAEVVRVDQPHVDAGRVEVQLLELALVEELLVIAARRRASKRSSQRRTSRAVRTSRRATTSPARTRRAVPTSGRATTSPARTRRALHTSRRATTSPARTRRASAATSRTARASQAACPEQRSTLTVKDIKRLWISGCAKPGTGGSYRTYCRCTYAHLAKAGALRSRKRLKELMRKLKPYERTHNIAKLPRFVRRAIYDCASKLPPLDPMAGKPVINQLPDSSHPSQPSSTPSSSGITPTHTCVADGADRDRPDGHDNRNLERPVDPEHRRHAAPLGLTCARTRSRGHRHRPSPSSDRRANRSPFRPPVAPPCGQVVGIPRG